jgi:N-acetylglucosaminyldiphosphoundecaprenol N-acetyl-beta-D-mannosaminyltransferase
LDKIFSFLLIPYFFFNLFFFRSKLYKKYWERICWSDLTKDLIHFSIQNNIKITIIDPYRPNDKAKIIAQKKFRDNLLKKFPELKFDFFIYEDKQKKDIINKIKNSDSKILFSTLWMKAQEESIIEILSEAKNIKLGLWVGSSFDYFIWFQKRAPLIFRKIWLEWFYRLITWPQKLKRLKRIYNAIFVFIFKVIVNKK